MHTFPESLKEFSVAGIKDLATVATTELDTLRASATPETVTDDQLDRMEELQKFITASAAEIDERNKRAARLTAASVTPVIPAEPEVETPAAVTADTSVKDVAEQVVTRDVANTETAVVDATVTASTTSTASKATAVADVAPLAPTVDVPQGDDAYSIVAAVDVAGVANSGAMLDWKGIGKAFVERTRSHAGMRKAAVSARSQTPLAMIRRNVPKEQYLLENDGDEQAFGKLKAVSDAYAKDPSLVAANGWCAPSEPDYSICNPITTDGLLSLPEVVARRGGIIHNQGLDFGDFFGDDFVLPIPGYNILTEAQVIADTAKTCLEIPCPSFVDDRLNVAALCLTSSLLQNRGYPEFVSEFVQGSIAAMAHLVNREVINEIVTGSTAVNLSTLDPWLSDGTFWSQVLSAVEFAITDMRHIYRAGLNQRFTVPLPEWVRVGMRADYIRGNARANNDIADGEIMAALSARGADVQWLYDWQDAFNAGTIPAAQQLGAATPPTGLPNTLQFLVWLPGTWVLARQDVIRLDTVYDSTNLQQNLVTQLFLEDGYKPMRMCQHSRVYTVNVCPTGATGAQRAIDCVNP